MSEENPFGEIISFKRPYAKQGAPRCGIYLVAPKPLRLNLFTEQARHAFAALNGSEYEKNMHALELRFPAKIYEKEREAASALVRLCQRNGVVPIVRGDLGLCVECGAEGLLAANAEEVKQARHVLGERAIIGMDCGNSREKAEEALAAEVDYVVFSGFFSKSAKQAELSLLEWWSSKTHLPAVAMGNLDINRAISMVRAGAGFIGAGSWAWNHKEGPARAVYWLEAAIEQGLSSQAMN